MSYKKWVNELKEIRNELYGEISIDSKGKKDRLESQKEDLIQMICSEFETVKEVFDETGVLGEMPKIEFVNEKTISLKFPIVRHTTFYSSGIDFGLDLVENGFGVQVKWIGHNDFVAPPIEPEMVREKILDYLKQRSEIIRKIEKKY